MVKSITAYAILISFCDFYIFNIPLSIFFMPLVFLYFLKYFNFNLTFLIINSFMIVLAILLYLIGFFNDQKINLATLIMLCVFFIFISLNKKNKNFPKLKQEIMASRSLPLILLFQPIFTLSQFIEFTFFGSFYLLNTFGQFTHPGPQGQMIEQLGGSAAYTPSIWTLWPRPNSTFSEPSVLAMILTISLNFYLWIYSGAKRNLFIALSIFSIISTLTATGIVMLSLSLLIYFNEVVKIRALPKFLTLASLFFIITLIIFQLGYFDRLYELNSPGKSGHTRITGPIQIILSSLYDNPVGLPAGNNLIIENSDVLKDGFGRTIGRFDNTYYFLIYYFGFFGLIFSFTTLIYFFYKGYKSEIGDVLPYFLISVMIFFTGGGYSPRFIFIFMFSILLLLKNDSIQVKNN